MEEGGVPPKDKGGFTTVGYSPRGTHPVNFIPLFSAHKFFMSVRRGPKVWRLWTAGGANSRSLGSEDSVVVKVGETAKLPCVVQHLNDKSVTWLRRRDLHILTAGHHTYSADQRFQVVHAEGSDEWTLVVRYAQLRDAGVYECQVNTNMKLSRPVTLKVYDSTQQMSVTKTKVFIANNTASTKDGDLRVEIIGPRELHIEEGSSLTLTCVVTSSKGPSNLVYWYHDKNLIDYNSPRGGVNLKIDRGRGETTTKLVVSSVGPGDSGIYSCVPQGSHPASVLVHVQKGEHEAAIQQGGLNAASILSASPLMACVIIALILRQYQVLHEVHRVLDHSLFDRRHFQLA
ncbi:uncharacterized protein LOC135213310 [Macrobrachium nipponense]|uniref:uncharacterized protein LOC135213310 n=1 Tax=Macrobrachium nipponense TaxID=159736 RepID=UPI0030C85F20